VALENPIPENNPTPHASRITNEQSSNPKPEITPAPARPQLPPTHTHCQITCKQEKNWWDRWKPFVELGGVLLLAVYTGYTIKIYLTNQDMVRIAQSANRPYVGVSSMMPVYIGVNSGGVSYPSERPNKETTSLSFRFGFKNFGPLPARNFANYWKVFVDGVEQRATKIPDHPITLFPTQETFLSGHIGTIDYPLIMNGTKVLEIQTRIEYDGPKERDIECTDEQFTPDYNGFFILSAECPKP
jgi:hypothetical protein